jgi:xylulokinase
MARSGRSTAYLGIDVGTSGLKVAALAASGRLLASSEESYAVSTPQPGWVESDPATWLRAVAAATARIGDVLADVDVAAIGCAGQMHGAVLCDDAGEAMAPAILWPDRRAESVLPRWRELTSLQRASLANPLVPGMTGPMLAWLVEHRPELADRASVALHAKDVVREHLTDRRDAAVAGVPVTDRSDASATLLWDVGAERWADDVCADVGVPGDLLPEVVSSSTVVGRSDWLDRVVPGASTDVPVVAGAADTPAAMIALGSTGLHVNLGTGAQVLVHAESARRPGADASTHLYADAGEHWYVMAAVQNAGLAVEHAAGILGLTWEGLVGAASRSRAGAGGASFLPFLSGERGGLASASSRGGWVGLGAGTTRDDVARAVFEGVTFAVRRSVELMGDVAAGAPEVTLTGGGGRDPWVRQLLSDVLSRPVRFADVRSASAIGAAVLAARGTGAVLHPVRPAVELTEPTPSAALEQAYHDWLARCPAAEL